MSNDRDQSDLIEALAVDCLERLAAEGDEVVARVCAAQPELIEPVRGVLRQLQSAGLTEEPVARESGQDFGDFRLLRKLGQGGMGVVWLAEQKSLHRRVALKLLHSVFQRLDRVRERFRREVQALSKLDHPNICTVYEAGEVGDQPYLAMRLIDGDSLADSLRKRRQLQASTGVTPRSTGSRELADLLHLIEKVARALHAAHEAGVVHRDVKPGNVLIDKSGEPMLVDFGLAHDDDPALSALTISGEPLGTPAYMAPEQIAGKGGVDRRTDVYALGATLYECVTLHAPFEAPNRESLFRNILRDPVRDPRAMNRAVGHELRAVLEKALDKSPRRRFDTALEFAEELRRIRMHEPIRTRTPGPVLRTVRWCQRNPAATLVLAVVSIALVVAMALLQRSRAAENRVRALALLAEADDVQRENPELAFKLCRAALMLQGDPAAVDPLVVRRTQQAMFQLRNSELVREEDNTLEWAEFSPDGAFLVISGPRLKPTIHKADDGERIGELPQTMSLQIPPIAFSPEDSEIAVGDDAGHACVYQLGHGLRQPRVKLTDGQPRAKVWRVAWSSDGARVALAHGDGRASVWTRDGRLVKELHPTDPAVAKGKAPWTGVAFLPDGGVVAAGAIWSSKLDAPKVLRGSDGEVPGGVRAIRCTDRRIITYLNEQTGARLWDHSGERIWESRLSEGTDDLIGHARFTPDGSTFAVTYLDGRLELRRFEDGELLDTLRNADAKLARFAFSPDGRRLSLANSSGALEIVELGGTNRLSLTGHQGSAFWVTFAPDGDRVVSASWDGTARIWNFIRSYPEVPQRLEGGLPDVARTLAGVVVATGRGEVLLCDEDANVLRRGSVGEYKSYVHADPAGLRAFISCFDRTIWLWDLARDGPPEQLDIDLDRPVWYPHFLADGRILIHASSPLAVYTWDQGSRREVLRELDQPSRIAVSRSGRRVLAGGMDGRWHLRDLQDGELVRIADGDTETGQPVASLAFSADERHALMGTAGGHVQYWDLDTVQRSVTYPKHRNGVWTVAIAPDGRRGASGSTDGTARVFDLDGQGQALVLGSSRRDAVWRVAFLDDRRLITASENGFVQWWWLDAKGLREVVEKVPIDPFTEEEAEPLRRRGQLGR